MHAEAAGGLGLTKLSKLSGLMKGSASGTKGAPVMFDVDLIHEDPNDSRTEKNPGFSEESLRGLAATFEGEGQLNSPISLRPHPDKDGHFLINFGRRRFRAALLLGWRQIPGFVDPKFSKWAQFIENVQRADLLPEEIAGYITDKLKEGYSQAEIAKHTGMSKTWVSHHVKLLSLPPVIAQAVSDGRVSDATLAAELAVAHNENPAAVAALLADPDMKPTRGQVKEMRAATKPAKVGKKSEKVTSPAKGTVPAGKEPAPANELDQQYNALLRLIEVARHDTGQSKRVADFLLAWWDAEQCGGFDLTDLWSVDQEIADDMMTVLQMIRALRSYPDSLGAGLKAEFEGLVRLCRPKLLEEGSGNG